MRLRPRQQKQSSTKLERSLRRDASSSNVTDAHDAPTINLEELCCWFRKPIEDVPRDIECDISVGSQVSQTIRRIKKPFTTRTWLIVLLIVAMGLAAAGALLGLNIQNARHAQQVQFEHVVDDFAQKLSSTLDQYMVAGLWVQQVCRSRLQTHASFRTLYEYLLTTNLGFDAVAFAMNVTSKDRLALESESLAYLSKHYPGTDYYGFTGHSRAARPWSESSYFPLHFIEPLEDNQNRNAMDFDISLSPNLDSIHQAITSGNPTFTPRTKLAGSDSYSVLLVHPGANVPSLPDDGPRDVSILALEIHELLVRSFANTTRLNDCVTIFLFDCTDHSTTHEYEFLGALGLDPADSAEVDHDVSDTDVDLLELRSRDSNYYKELRFLVGSRTWTFVVLAEDEAFQPELTFIIFGAIMIFVASTCLALWIWTSSRRVAKMNKMQATAEAEKDQMVVDNAKKAAQQERELNDFIAHEVRNPLAAAISACSFVSSAVNEAEPLVDEQSRQSVREDVIIIDSSLQFINDLLRNMLDVHRASSKQLHVESTPVGLLEDVLQPVASMIYKRGDDFELEVECPSHLVVLSDGLRLKQVMLNLGRNAAKFVTRGFIRLRATSVEDKVYLFVEDSGPGIPREKRGMLFAKFQESLDSLHQGTGIGLCLCQNLVELMGGEIWLDENYHSGIEGFPGTRFVISLNTGPVVWEQSEQSLNVDMKEDGSTSLDSDSLETPESRLPPSLSVLFVDDSFVLRKLFGRVVKTIVPSWTIEEAASGETALRMVETTDFDLIFMDQYMASTDKQLLGTETVRVLRGKGVKSIIVGLSANDLGKAFENAGANFFMIKPFPCQKEELTKELMHILGLMHKGA